MNDLDSIRSTIFLPLPLGEGRGEGRVHTDCPKTLLVPTLCVGMQSSTLSVVRAPGHVAGLGTRSVQDGIPTQSVGTRVDASSGQGRFRAASARRRGLASVVMLVALFVLGLIAIGLVKVAFARRAEVAREERRVQADWLAESGIARAIAQLRASADYSGESWKIPAEEFGGRGPADVTIQIKTPADKPGQRQVHVEADYPAGSSLPSRQSRTIIVAIPSPSR